MVHAGQGGVGLVGLGWSGLVRVVKICGWVGLGWVGVGGWVGKDQSVGRSVRVLQGMVSTMGKKNKCSNENEFILYHN